MQGSSDVFAARLCYLLRDVAAAHLETINRSEGLKMSERMRILIVDDLARTRRSLKALVSTWSRAGALQEAASGREAIELAEQWKPQAILMDVCMGEMDGLQATRAIKASRPEMKIIVISMYGDYEAQALAAGADAFVNKGEPAARLLEALDHVAAA
jgi:CheY-like chemotaxis protein